MVLMLVVFALSRWPELLPSNFSAAYALAFCAGVFFPRRHAWWLPLGTMLVTDVALNLFYQSARGIECFTVPVLVYMAGNYAGYAGLVALGQGFKPRASWWRLLGGGLLGAVLFYLLTNTASWLLNPFRNPEYTGDLAGWIIALTKGTAGHPPTWEFFRNTLLSGGLFTGLFVGAFKWCERLESAEEKEPAESESPDAEPEEGKA